jgi:hypothetical protein
MNIILKKHVRIDSYNLERGNFIDQLFFEQKKLTRTDYFRRFSYDKRSSNVCCIKCFADCYQY